MRTKKKMNHDLYKCSNLGDTAHIKTLYEIHTSPGRETLVRFGCAECTKCGVGTQISAWEMKVNWAKCTHPLSPVFSGLQNGEGIDSESNQIAESRLSMTS